jgi:hypothetical protein
LKGGENMGKMRSPHWYKLSLILTAILVAGCAAKGGSTGAFTQTSRIESELKRGVSTRMDVQRVLGTPKGSGNAVFPSSTGWRPREVWYYEDIEVTGARSERGINRNEIILRANVRQQILLVFFEKGVFDGFMWWSNAGEATGHPEEF